ncbi:DUF397 domain-containing protein [Streptomyces somaliensis DSM 40738]|uniref:DUF397 domain-containing protein n=1 Tax=Streptomyces somaliensis (strain ATCC 33201 / DSM 40738 / JCM 12659 / KCTC 9044 / NCTC 11332 / NRRL B-12077 / IP 733) TaxID=1134445 RepID=A0AA44IBE7_STRE0|nr:DUF397 domain-containing protein [Streptomyces somaliensis]MCQ0024344.1 DUF397 domain-containing protein [Streptomyces somaliensis DSM 40738]NKY12669.1 DUF397 domain-containing protein [Streptomyces somaliensis DSM 40738]
MIHKTAAGVGTKSEWIKSSYSSDDGPSCIEVAWFKSSYSTPDGPDCVEVATVPDRILVRDSKNPAGPRLALTPATWAAFLPYASGH